MSDRLTLHTRERLRSSIEATLIAAQADAIRLSADLLVDELQADAEELALSGLLVGLTAALGPELGKIALADLTGRLAESDAEVAKRLGTTPQAVSKTLIRVRRNLGYPPRVPNNANGGVIASMRKARS
jgi:hypothetical protein